MFLGSRVDDALSAYHRRILEHGDRLALDQVLDIYREQWSSELEAEHDKQRVEWEEELGERAAFELGRQAIELAMAELIPHLGDPVDVQRRQEFPIAPDLEWTVLCYLGLETLRETPDGEQSPSVVDFKVKNTPITKDRADSDPQAGLYLAGRWLEGYPADELCFAQIAKPGKRRKNMSALLVPTSRTAGQLRGVLVRLALAGKPDRGLLRALRTRSAVGLRRPDQLEVQPALLLALGGVSGGQGALVQTKLRRKQR
jgi:hypothetical protein